MPHLQTIVLAKSWYCPHRGGGILRIIQVSCIRRAFLEGERKSLKPFLGPDLKELSSNTNRRNFTLITTYVVFYSKDVGTKEKLLKREFISAFTEMISNTPSES